MLHFFYGKFFSAKFQSHMDPMMESGILSFPPESWRCRIKVIPSSYHKESIFHQKLNGTPKEVARAIRFSGLGVRSAGPVGDFLDIHVDSMPFALIPCCCSMPPALKLTHPCPLKIALLKRNWVSQPPLHNIYIYTYDMYLYIYMYTYIWANYYNNS